MTTGATTLLSLALPVEGELDGTWGDVVNYGITDYVDIAVAGTLTLTGDGAVTLANTAGTASGTNIGSTTAQYAIIKITGTLTTTKVVTGPSSSKTYIVDNAATGGTVTFKASGQTGVSVAVGEKCTVYFNGTDYVKVASSVVDGVSTISFGSTGLTPATATSGAVTVAGTLAVANGGTGVTTSTGTGNVVLSTSPTLSSPTLVTPALGTPASGVATNLTGLPLTTGVTGILPVANGGTGTATPTLYAGTGISVTGTWPAQTITSTNTGTITSVTASAPLASSGGTTPNISLSGALPVANGGTGTTTPNLVAGSNVTISGTWPNQTIAAVGGGGTTAGIYPAIASGNLANGDKVVINADGTVSTVSNTIITAGSAGTVDSGRNTANSFGTIAATYDSTNNRVVVAYINGANSDGFAAVGTVSGTAISFGTPVNFDSSVSCVSATFDSTNGKVVIAYGTNTFGSGGKAIVGTVSGTAISYGTAVAFDTASSTYVAATFDSANGKVVIAYRPGSSASNAIVGTVSGTSISFGTAVAFSSTNCAYIAAVYAGTKIVISYRDGGNSFYGTSIVGTVSGTSISFGTAAVFSSTISNYISSVYDSTNTKVVIAFSDNGNSDYGTAVVGTVSGTSISFGSKVVYSPAFTNSTGMAYSSASGCVVINYGLTSAIGGIVSGTSITFGPAYTYSTGGFYPVITYNSTAQKPVIVYAATAGGIGKAQTLTISANLTATNFIGISDAAYSSGAMATIQTVGSTDDAQSGLTAGLAYYVQPNGTLASTAGTPSVFAGTAVSATKIIIKG